MRAWQIRGLAGVRIVFGVVLSIDAALKWPPAFSDHFLAYLTDAAQGQPPAFAPWFEFWIGIVRANPGFYAHVVAVGETLVAAGLLLGALSAVVDLFGAVLMFVIWSTAEGFGGPYKSGSTDIGTAVIYVLVFAALYFSKAGWYFGLDRFLGNKLGPWSWLASGDPP